jgi:hypothetical protein
MKNLVVIKNWYVRDLIPVAEIAKRLDCSRPLIYRILKSLGVDTTKKPFIEILCKGCGKPFSVRRCRARKRPFCSPECRWRFRDKNKGT